MRSSCKSYWQNHAIHCDQENRVYCNIVRNDSCTIAILISGDGSNLQSIIDHIQQDHICGRIACVISNNPHAYGLVRAKQSNIPTHVIEHTKIQFTRSF